MPFENFGILLEFRTFYLLSALLNVYSGRVEPTQVEGSLRLAKA